MSVPLDRFLGARDLLLAHRSDYAAAARDFRWPQLDRFNWALDYFDSMAQGNDAPALWIVGRTEASIARRFDSSLRGRRRSRTT